MKEKGFTFIEVMIAFSIFLIITTIIPPSIKAISYQPKLHQRLETTLFFQQLALDMQQAASISVENQTLYLQKENNQKVSYAFFQQKVRRQVNFKGQEFVLQNVATITFSQWTNGIDVTVQDIYNHRQKRRITHLLPLGGE